MNWRVWGWPVVMAAASSIGLVAALLSDVAAWDGLWSAVLALPVVVAVRHVMSAKGAR